MAFRRITELIIMMIKHQCSCYYIFLILRLKLEVYKFNIIMVVIKSLQLTFHSFASVKLLSLFTL